MLLLKQGDPLILAGIPSLHLVVFLRANPIASGLFGSHRPPAAED
jgi:hypothetical protein